ncbi:hypothetical protein N7524_006029 [Penicillium chrysogenum]|nr:hypothetical protein N7524_006029 [Penicillium chrysogenum]
MKLSSLFTSFTFLAQGFLTLALNSGQLYCGSSLNAVDSHAHFPENELYEYKKANIFSSAVYTPKGVCWKGCVRSDKAGESDYCRDLGELYISERTEKCSAKLVTEFMGKTIKTPLQQKRAELRLAQGLTNCLFDSSGPNQDDEGRRTEFNNRLRWLSRTQETLAAEIKEVENGGAVLGYDTKNNAAAT